MFNRAHVIYFREHNLLSWDVEVCVGVRGVRHFSISASTQSVQAREMLSSNCPRENQEKYVPLPKSIIKTASFQVRPKDNEN